MILQNETIITCWAQVHAAVSLWSCDRDVFKPSGHRKSTFARKSLFWLNKKDTDEGDTSSAVSEYTETGREKKKDDGDGDKDDDLVAGRNLKQ